MSGTELIKSAVRPPFANYDLVVYFGCGIFSVPFFIKFVAEPLGLDVYDKFFTDDVSISLQIIGIITVFFTIYIYTGIY